MGVGQRPTEGDSHLRGTREPDRQAIDVRAPRSWTRCADGLAASAAAVTLVVTSEVPRVSCNSGSIAVFNLSECDCKADMWMLQQPTSVLRCQSGLLRSRILFGLVGLLSFLTWSSGHTIEMIIVWVCFCCTRRVVVFWTVTSNTVLPYLTWTSHLSICFIILPKTTHIVVVLRGDYAHSSLMHLRGDFLHGIAKKSVN